MNREFIIMPYARVNGSWNLTDSELGIIFDRMVIENLIKTVFYDGSVTERDQFLRYFQRPDIAAIGAWKLEMTLLQPVVWIWLTGAHNGTAFIHFCTFGGCSIRDKIRAASDIVQRLFGFFDCLVGVTPENLDSAVRFANLVGFKTLGKIPGMIYLPYEGKRTGAIISYAQKA